MADPPSRPFIVAAGRLEYQKAHDLLLEAFAKSAACKDLDLVILGKGSREERLKAQAAELGIADRVHFRGFAANPWGLFLQGADVRPALALGGLPPPWWSRPWPAARRPWSPTAATAPRKSSSTAKAAGSCRATTWRPSARPWTRS
ncbi:MAG: glycosyltransferase [Caulobacteraceae bacterium]